MNHKRFIAGAVCPACGTMDSIRTFRSETQQSYRECVDCGYTDKLQDDLRLQGDLPKARIAREESVLEEHTDVIRFIDITADG